MRFKKTTVLTDAQINREKNALYLGQKKESLNQFDRQYPYYSQSTLNPHLDRTHHKNVIIILLESFGAGHVKGLSPLYKDVATNMAEWGKKEILFTNGFTNHSPTGPAQFQMMCPLYDGGYSIRHHEDLKILCGPEVLKQNGFETMLFMGHHLKFDNVYNFWRRHGIQKFVGEDEFPLEKLAHLPEGHFGSFTDEQLYRAALDYLEKRNNDESKKSKPFLTFILGVSSHAPFPDFGERYRNQEGTPVIQRLHGAMNYSDAALNQFLIEASKQPWFNDTLIIAVGDHPPPLPPGESVAEQTGNESYRVRVPILAVNLTKDDALKAKLKNKLMGQVDIMPTVLDWLGITTQWGSTGVSMLDETVNEDERQVYAYDSYSNTYHLINTKGYLTKDYRHGQTWGNLADDESSRLLETLKDVNQWVYDNDRIMK
jgi:phosphoglycerol transferase MdoB-like AlkP superfamily enzyme